MASKTCNLTSSISASFSGSGTSCDLVVSGSGNANIKMKLSWGDNPDNYGDAIDSISVLGRTWNSPGEDGSDTSTIANVTAGTYGMSFSGLLNSFKSVSSSSIKMIDNDGNDTNAEFTIESVTNNTFSETVTATMTSPNNVIGSNSVATSWAGTGPSGTTYSKTGPGTNSTSSSGNATITGGNSNPCGGTSPVVKTWTMTTSSPNGCTVSASSSTNIYNDDRPNDNWTTSFINLEPSTQVTLNLGTMSCIDAPSTVTVSGAGNFVGKNGSFSTSKNFNDGDTVQLKTTTLGFNTSTSGTGTTGSTNSKVVTVTFDNRNSYSKNITITTRAPVIKETFNYADNTNKYPYEDIDLITNSPTEHLASAQIETDDIEIPVEIKVDKPDAQISINGGGWQNARSI